MHLLTLHPLPLFVLLCVSALCLPVSPAAEPGAIFAKENLVAWCIVPFDAGKRSPRERAAMLARLGITKCAYDWRDEHVPEFEEEILAYREHGIAFHAHWAAGQGKKAGNEEMFRLLEKYDLHPEIWVIAPNRKEWLTREERIAGAIAELTPLLERAREIDCAVALYNHGGWSGEPENLVTLVKALRKKFQTDQIGISYVLHHAHDHLEKFPEAFDAMVPYLYCVSLNGMRKPEAKNWEKILPLGSGTEDKKLLRMIRDSGYRGPIGILDHRPALDTEESLRENLKGLERIAASLP